MNHDLDESQRGVCDMLICAILCEKAEKMAFICLYLSIYRSINYRERERELVYSPPYTHRNFAGFFLIQPQKSSKMNQKCA